MTRLKRIMVWTVLAGIGVFVVAAGLIAISGLRDDIRPADVAVVLGNEVRAGGTPHPRLAARLDAALALYDSGVAKNVIVSGGIGRSGFDEAAVMKSYLAARGVPAEAPPRRFPSRWIPWRRPKNLYAGRQSLSPRAGEQS